MSFLSVLKKIFGDKATRDNKALEPIVQKIEALEPEVKKLTNDQLREKINEVRRQIADQTKPMEEENASLREKIEKTPYEERQPLWDKIDENEKKILDTIETLLDQNLPIVFATIRETAARFAASETIEVTATQMDRDLAAQGRDFVSIEGDKALWRNHWMAGGNEIIWDMVHYREQLKGGIVLTQGKIAEMATGEGKTLVATLPVFLRSLSRRGVHVVTVNDYLSKRDSEWMGPLYMFHGATVDCIDKHEPNTPERRAAYQCDITFGTNNEFGFDYLRDNMALSPEDLVQRKHYYAIVDEVDSVLIDDARTPLIISGPVSKGDDQLFDQFKRNVQNVVEAQRRLFVATFNEAKRKLASDKKEDQTEGAMLLYRCYKALPKNSALIKFLSQEGMRNILLDAEKRFLDNNQAEMPVVTDPLYFVIDEKNRTVELTDKGIDELTGSSEDPEFFVLPDIATQLSALEEIPDLEERERKKDELMQNYAVKSERVHTVTQLLKAYTLFEKDVEYVIDDNKIKIVDEQTGRIMEGRRYSDGLHQAIEAKENVKVEAATQTFATITLQNYFRMYHKLAGMTGTAETEAGEFWEIYKLDVVTIPTHRPVARIDLEDRVYRTRGEKYDAIIDEIVRLHAIGRPVLVGTTSVEISEKLSKMLQMRHIDHNVLNAKLHAREAEIVALAGREGAVTIATNMAGRGTDIKISEAVRNLKDPAIAKGKEVGGLAIIGTERHESRRVDRQLRGRSGRQGDPGSSVFFVSFEDPLMRMFTSDTVLRLLDKMDWQKGEPLEHSMLSGAIEKAQKRVEENNFGIRKRLLEYDDVMNKQRTYIYSRRHNALMGERIGVDIMNMIADTIENLVINYESAADYDDLRTEMIRVLTIEPPFNEKEQASMSREEKIKLIYGRVMETLERRSQDIKDVLVPALERSVAAGETGIRTIPITDGRLIFPIYFDLEQAASTGAESVIKEWRKKVVLAVMDELWKDHLRELDQLRQSVQNASYEQKDPLVIYKVESFHLFEAMLSQLNSRVVSTLMRGKLYFPPRPAAAPAPANKELPEDQTSGKTSRPSEPEISRAMPRRRTGQEYKTSKATLPSEEEAQRRAASAPQGQREPSMPVRNSGPRIGRNDPCPCGSGKKYKNCHGRGL